MVAQHFASLDTCRQAVISGEQGVQLKRTIMNVELNLDDLKNDVRVLLYILVPSVLLTFLLGKLLLGDIIHSVSIAEKHLSSNSAAIYPMAILLQSIHNFGVAIWLAVAIKKWERPRLIWFLFGLFAGYQLIPVYFLLYITGIHPIVSSRQIIVQLENLSFFLIPVFLIVGPFSFIAIYNFGRLAINTGSLDPEKLLSIGPISQYLVNAAVSLWFIVVIARFRRINKLPWAILSLCIGFPVVIIHTLFVSIAGICLEGGFNSANSQNAKT